LLLRFPKLRSAQGAVASALAALDAPPEAVAEWRRTVRERLEADRDDY
jgi:hypothetical protein